MVNAYDLVKPFRFFEVKEKLTTFWKSKSDINSVKEISEHN